MSEEIALSAQLKRLLRAEGGAVSVGQLIDKVGDRGFGLILILLSLPSALPIPAAGYSVPFGILLLLLALQMIAGKPKPVFPEKFRKVELSEGMSEKMVNGSAWILKKLELIIRPRFTMLYSKTGRRLMGVVVLTMALLMMIPIPLTNTAPAFVIFLIGVGLTEEDGLFGFLALLAGIAAITLYIALIIAIIYYGPEVVDTIKEAIKGFVKSV